MTTDDAGPLPPEAAAVQRDQLLADVGFRQRAAAGGAEWQQLAALNAAIAVGLDCDELEAPQPEQRVHHHDHGEDPAAVGQYRAPESPKETLIYPG